MACDMRLVSRDSFNVVHRTHLQKDAASRNSIATRIPAQHEYRATYLVPFGKITTPSSLARDMFSRANHDGSSFRVIQSDNHT